MHLTDCSFLKNFSSSFNWKLIKITGVYWFFSLLKFRSSLHCHLSWYTKASRFTILHCYYFWFWFSDQNSCPIFSAWFIHLLIQRFSNWRSQPFLGSPKSTNIVILPLAYGSLKQSRVAENSKYFERVAMQKSLRTPVLIHYKLYCTNYSETAVINYLCWFLWPLLSTFLKVVFPRLWFEIRFKN